MIHLQVTFSEKGTKITPKNQILKGFIRLALGPPQYFFKQHLILIQKGRAIFIIMGKDVLCILLKYQPCSFSHELFPATPVSQSDLT